MITDCPNLTYTINLLTVETEQNKLKFNIKQTIFIMVKISCLLEKSA